MRGVRFGNNRAARRQSRGRISTRDGEGQREVAGTKHRDRAQRDLLCTQVGPRERLAFRQRMIDGGGEKTSFPDQGSEETKLTGSSSPFPFDTRAREAGFSHHTIDQDIAKINDSLCDRFKKLRAPLEADGSIAVEGCRCESAGGVDVVGTASAERGFDFISGCRVDCPLSSFCSETYLSTNELFAGQFHCGSPWLLSPLINCWESLLKPGTRLRYRPKSPLLVSRSSCDWPESRPRATGNRSVLR